MFVSACVCGLEPRPQWPFDGDRWDHRTQPNHDDDQGRHDARRKKTGCQTFAEQTESGMAWFVFLDLVRAIILLVEQ